MKHVLVILIVMLTSCKKGSSSSTPPPDDDARFDERQACAADADCVVVEVECCDQCNGGLAVGIHRDHAAEVRAAYVPADECADVACTLMACEPATAFCRQGVCGLRRGDREDVPALPPP